MGILVTFLFINPAASMNIGSTAGTISGAVAALVALIIVIYCCCCRKKKEEEEEEEEFTMGAFEDE
ncbi:Cell surface A33 antigen [Liparis tanakae]|uniref:Cell surface A33 antigen n=1 Tax=Liparis tanakae TaxID=230148 RepID=A0A4Z2FMM2_9TELE|nr:Cell surface A33 antigen [Liparis tanakae]